MPGAADPTVVVARVREVLGDTVRRVLTAGSGSYPEFPIADAADPGLFGPDSITWRVHGHRSMLVGGLRALLVQALHPLAMAGVAEHSSYRTDPLGRLARTGRFVATTTYGTTDAAERAIAGVQAVHGRVRGVALDGRRYDASDPALLSWVHNVEVESFLTAYRTYGPGTSEAEAVLPPPAPLASTLLRHAARTPLAPRTPTPFKKVRRDASLLITALTLVGCESKSPPATAPKVKNVESEQATTPATVTPPTKTATENVTLDIKSWDETLELVAQHKGKVVVLDVWSTSCEPCMAEFPHLVELHKQHGEKLKIRWDYAFYQMILETNYLKFVNGAGKGDVNPKQNNFAGIGTTGGGVPGDSFPDVSTGVLAQMQHLVAYSGEHVANPAAKRTREKQDEIIAKSKALGRPVTFKDLTRRWAADGRYASSISFVAGRFTSRY